MKTNRIGALALTTLLPLGLLACGDDGSDDQEAALRGMLTQELAEDPEAGDACLGIAFMGADRVEEMLLNEIQNADGDTEIPIDEGDDPEEIAMLQEAVDELGAERAVEVLVDTMEDFCADYDPEDSLMPPTGEGEPMPDMGEEGIPDDTVEEEMISLEGSVLTEDGSFVEYPDGLRVDFVSAEISPTDNDFAIEDGDTHEVLIKLKLSNVGTAPVLLSDDGSSPMPFNQLFYGVNQYEGRSWFHDEGNYIDELPRQLVPGTSADLWLQYTVDDPSELSLYFNMDPDRYTDFTFTDIDDAAQVS